MSEGSTSSVFFCDLAALSAIEQQRRRELAESVVRAAKGRSELSNGYAITLDARKITVAALSEWVALESRCCPFLSFEVRTDSLSEQAMMLELTGADGVKEFLRAEFSR
jgi:hypothetical protein